MDRPIDHWLVVRKAVVAHLTANAPIAGKVLAANIWGEAPPAKIGWPFIRLGMEITTPWTATGLEGSAHRVTIHAFDKNEDTAEISRISAAVVEIMHSLVIPSLDLVDLQWVGTSVIRDTDEKGAYHAICDFDLIAVLSS